MATDFWNSSHRRSLTTREALRLSHGKDRKLGLSEDDIQAIKCCVIDFYSADLSEIAKASQQLIRQRRFYLLNDFCDYDPRSIGLVCLYLASKAEEAPVAAKLLFQIMRNVSALPHARPHLTLPKLLDLEMALLESLDYNLIVFSPYRDLAAFLADPNLTGLADFAWAALNDSLRTDAFVLYPPFVIAIAALNVASAACKHDLQPWLKNIDLCLDTLADATADIFYSYKKHNANLSPEDFCRFMELTNPGTS